MLKSWFLLPLLLLTILLGGLPADDGSDPTAPGTVQESGSGEGGPGTDPDGLVGGGVTDPDGVI